MKKILITGKDSCIGTFVEAGLVQSQYAGMYQEDTADLREEIKQRSMEMRGVYL